jgi:hypothetical protein
MGFPNSKNKRIRSHRANTPSIWLYHSVAVESPRIYERLKLSGDEHIVLHYDSRSADERGVMDNTFYPAGVSGGPLFDVCYPWTEERVSGNPNPGVLTGMLIEYDADLGEILFVKVSQIFDQIRQVHGYGAAPMPASDSQVP